jgi:uncharacterized membrane protein YfcA
MASLVGAVCGIGGGILIKPILDAFGILDIASISFLSGCTVLAMTGYCVIQSKIHKKPAIDIKSSTVLGIGAAIGGIAGKTVFQSLWLTFPDKNQVGMVQAACLVVVVIGTLAYTVKKDTIHTRKINNPFLKAGIGLLLGFLSSFLGIGGGPANLVVLFYFFSMDIKTASQNSLYIILISQITALISTAATNSVPEVDPILLTLMIASGILGGMAGSKINKKIEENTLKKLFVVVMIAVLAINSFNIFKYSF